MTYCCRVVPSAVLSTETCCNDRFGWPCSDQVYFFKIWCLNLNRIVYRVCDISRWFACMSSLVPAWYYLHYPKKLLVSLAAKHQRLFPVVYSSIAFLLRRSINEGGPSGAICISTRSYGGRVVRWKRNGVRMFMSGGPVPLGLGLPACGIPLMCSHKGT